MEKECLRCGKKRKIRSRYLCASCYTYMQRIGKLDDYPKYKGRITTCVSCGNVDHIYSREMCERCYRKWYENQEDVKEKRIERERERRKIDKYKEKKRESDRKYYFKNKEKIRAYAYLWSRKNPQSHREADKRRRARKAMAECSLTLYEWNTLLEIFDYRCAYCDKKCMNLEREHWNPLINGGAYSITNIVPSCRSCNASKATLSGEEFLNLKERQLNEMAQN